MKRFLLRWAMIIAGWALILYVSVFYINLAWSHETDEVKHFNGSIKMVGTGPCGMTSIWWLDTDEDFKVDTCWQVQYTHDKIHYREFQPVDGRCICPEGK